jgi:PEP-CTERM motif-containing protein
MTAALIMIAAPASADSIIAVELFNYTGVCTDCSFSTGTLELIGGYTPGSPITTSNFLDFTYTSNLANFSINQNDTGFSVSGGLPATLPGPATLLIEDDTWEFSSMTGGSWFVNSLVPQDFGPSNTFSAASTVPEPGAMAMLGLGLGAVIAVRARNRR